MPANQSPAIDPETQEALSKHHSNSAIIILPLTSGRFAIFGRDFALHDILDEAPSSQDLRRLSRTLTEKLHTFKLLSFYGEPEDRELAKDLKRARTPIPTPRPTADIGEVIDI